MGHTPQVREGSSSPILGCCPDHVVVVEARGPWPGSLATFPGHSWSPGKDPGLGALDPGSSDFQAEQTSGIKHGSSHRDRESNFCSVLC